MLSERDVTSKAVIGFIAQFAANYPSKILDDIFSYLDSNESVQRRNALDVSIELSCSLLHYILVEVFKINRQTIQNAQLSERLAVHLLKRLGDSELALRTEAASLFSNLEPAFIIPRLAQLTSDRDARVRSAADEALMALLNGHKDVNATMEVLLDCLR